MHEVPPAALELVPEVFIGSWGGFCIGTNIGRRRAFIFDKGAASLHCTNFFTLLNTFKVVACDDLYVLVVLSSYYSSIISLGLDSF